MRGNRLLLGCAVLVALGAAVHALEGVNGSVATSLFKATDVPSNIIYPPGFSGVPWDDPSIIQFEFGHANYNEFLAAGPSGDLFLAVIGRTGQPPRYKGLIQWDGTDFLHLVQYVASESKIWSVTVSPATAGLLTEGHPVIVREDPGEGGAASSWELWSIDPTTSPATETFVHSSSTRIANAVIDGAGDIYVLDGAGIVKLTYNGTGYEESVLTASEVYPAHLALGADGALYALEAGTVWGAKKGSNDILRVDPDTGATSVHASVSRKYNGFFALVWDSNGRFWIGLQGSSDDVITEVHAGGTIGTRASVISRSIPFHTRAMAAGPDGELYVAAWDTVEAGAATEVFELIPGEGGDDGGGGKGGGKGKNK